MSIEDTNAGSLLCCVGRSVVLAVTQCGDLVAAL